MSSKKGTKTAPNIKAAANRLNVPHQMLSDAKNLGCEAFALRGSVDLDRYAEWLSTHPEFAAKWKEAGAIPDKAVSEAWKAHFEKELRRIRVEKELRKLIPRTDRADQVREISARLMQIAVTHIRDSTAKAAYVKEARVLATIFDT